MSEVEAQPGAISGADPEYVIDLSNLRAVAGQAQAIFVGSVESATGTKALGVFPESQFRVNIIQSLKGNRSGSITVNQQGGKTSSGKVLLFDGDPLIETGKTYLFATRYLASENWYTVIPHVGHTLVADVAGSLARGTVATSSPLIAKWTDAIAHALPPVGRLSPLPSRSDTSPGSNASTAPQSAPSSSSSTEQTAPQSSSPSSADPSAPPTS